MQSASGSAANIARKGEDDVLLNLLRRQDSPVTANDIGFDRSSGKTAYEWCSTAGKNVLVSEMNFFLVNNQSIQKSYRS